MTNIESKIEFFFESPNKWVDGRTKYSNLYLLRRDIYTCFGVDPSSQVKINYCAIWPATMSILAGIDLLSKYYYGQDDGKVGERFIGYFKKYINDQDFEIIYQLRNSLLHSFGLYSFKIDKKTNIRKEYYFALTSNENRLVSKIKDNSYLIDVYTLWREFEKSITLYYKELREDNDLKIKFDKMFPYYSITDIS